MKDIFRLLYSLTIIGLIAGLGLGGVYAITAKKIEQQALEARKEALKKVLPEYEVNVENAQTINGLTYWTARKEGKIAAYAFIAKGKGYSSEIQTMVGITKDGQITGISILFQQETPGLGARLEEIASDKYIWNPFKKSKTKNRPWFTEQFANLDVSSGKAINIVKGQGEWTGFSEAEREKLNRENSVTALTGATISTSAVCHSVAQTATELLKLIEEKGVH